VVLFQLFACVIVSIFLGLWLPKLGTKKIRARADVSMLCAAVIQYRATYGLPPSGNHAQILAALRGENLRHIRFLDRPSKSFNERGELLDPWGRPYRIDTTNPAFPWAYSLGKNARDDGGAPGSDDVPSW
jgi:hypothetical protein